MVKMCAYSSSKYALPYWKLLLRCCAQFPRIYLPIPESDQHNSNVSPKISFHVYQKFHVLPCMKDALLMKRYSANYVILPLTQK